MRFWILLLIIAWGTAAGAAETNRLTVVAESSNQWTGVAVSPAGRLFVNFPRWSSNVVISVGEVLKDGTVKAFPDAAWNTTNETVDPGQRWVCVQSVVADQRDRLWVLDPAAPFFRGPVAGGPKLLAFNLADGDQLQETYLFDERVAPPGSYLNDVRVDTTRDVAYITDSGLGAIVVVHLASGRARRVLEGHASTRSEGIGLTIEGRTFLLPDGSRPDVHADGLALSPEGEWLYYQALTGRTLYRVPTRALLDTNASPAQVAAEVETVGRTGAADGLTTGPDGRLYLASIEDNSVRVLGGQGVADLLFRDRRLAWPDSIAFGTDGALYVTSAQIHRDPASREPYRIFRWGAAAAEPGLRASPPAARPGTPPRSAPASSRPPR